MMDVKILFLSLTRSNITLQTVRKRIQYVLSLQGHCYHLANHFTDQHVIQQGGDACTVLLYGQVHFADLSKYLIPVQI